VKKANNLHRKRLSRVKQMVATYSRSTLAVRFQGGWLNFEPAEKIQTKSNNFFSVLCVS